MEANKELIDTLHTVRDLNEFVKEYSTGYQKSPKQEETLGVIHMYIHKLLTHLIEDFSQKK